MNQLLSESFLLTAPHQAQWVQETLPSPGDGEILVQTKFGAISIGSELPQYRGDDLAASDLPYPRMTGYESVGTVVACGPHVQEVCPSDQVVCSYGHRTHAIVDYSRAILIPPSLDPRVALLCILSCDAAKGVLKLSETAVPESCLITGAGVMGLLAVHFLKRRLHVQRVVVAEPDEGRRALARLLGADAALEPSRLSDEVFASGLECSGRNAGFALLQAQAAAGATICVLSDGNVERLMLTAAFHRKELRVVASSDGYDYHAHARWFFNEAPNGLHRLLRLFQLTVQAEQLPECFARLASGLITPVKVLVEYPAIGSHTLA